MVRYSYSHFMKDKPRCAVCGKRATRIHLADDAPRPYCPEHRPWKERDFSELYEADANATQDRPFADIPRAKRLEAWRGGIWGQPHPDEMGVWERIWTAAGYLTKSGAPNSFAMVHRLPGKIPTLAVPTALWERDDREGYRQARESLFEQAVAECCFYGGRELGEPLLDAWEWLGRPKMHHLEVLTYWEARDWHTRKALDE